MPTLLTLALIASDVYNDGSRGDVVGFRRVALPSRMDNINRRASSFFGAAYVGGDVGVVAFRGSAESTDWLDADFDIGVGRLPIDQFGDAVDFFGQAQQLLSAQSCQRVVVTGHSLGGGLTQLVAAGGARMPVAGVTFNAPGMASLTGSVQVRTSNAGSVFNFRARHDPVSMSGAHIGRGPYVVDVQIGTGSRVLSGVVGSVGTVVGGPLVGGAGSMAVTAGMEHTMAPMVEALRSSAFGGIRY